MLNLIKFYLWTASSKQKSFQDTPYCKVITLQQIPLNENLPTVQKRGKKLPERKEPLGRTRLKEGSHQLQPAVKTDKKSTKRRQTANNMKINPLTLTFTGACKPVASKKTLV